MAKKKARRERAEPKEPMIHEYEGEGYDAVLDQADQELVIRIPTDRKGRPSKSGKMNLIASSRGWVTIGGISLSLNVGRKVE